MSETPTLAQFFAKHITSKHNQHAIVGIKGSAGMGKSWLGLALARAVADEVARIKGGVSEDYFDIKNDLGVISRDEIQRIMTNPRRYTIKFLDDIGIAWNARKYRDDFNMFLNDLIQSFRPNNNLVLMTVQYDFLVDRVPRSLMHFSIEMKDSWFDQGITTAKVFKLQYNDRMNKMYMHHIQYNGEDITQYVSHAPPENITKAYEIERALQLERTREVKEEANKEERLRLKKKDYAIVAVDNIMKELNCSIAKACNIVGIDPAYYSRLKA